MTPIRGALQRARVGIYTIAAIYAVSVPTGMIMAHAGNSFALRRRDAIVHQAHRTDPASRANDRGEHAVAAAIDFGRNVGQAAIPETVGGFILVLPPALAAYRGWVGGIVSVDAAHQSRLANVRSAAYYVSVMLLQLIGFTLAGGSGLYLGWANLRHQGPFVGPRWFRLPRTALVDVCWIYTVALPAFAVGSLVEFL
jgi:hypothetical protein